MSGDVATDICFVDSNVWLYILLPGQDTEKANAARNLVRQPGIRIHISTQVVNEIVNGIIRHSALNETDIRAFIESLYARYTVVPISEPIQLNASHLREHYALSHWDSLIVSAALDAGAIFLYTEDMQDKLMIEGRLTVVNPFRV